MSYYPINEDTARRAKEMMSFHDYILGSMTAEYKRMVDEAVELGERQKRRVDPMYHEKVDRLVDTYARRLADNLNEKSRIGTMCPSIMISGGSNFPVRKKEKQNAALDRNMQDYKEVQKILDKIKSVGTGGISSYDPQALDKLRVKLAKLVATQERMKAANAAIRLKNAEKGDAKLSEMGYTPEEIKSLREPDFCGRVGYPSYLLSNNNANIKRVRDRITTLEKKQAEPAPEGWEFDGGSVVANAEENRLQILFDEKPDEETRAMLKQNGFRWSPRNSAWQRQLTPNAESAARRLFGSDSKGV